MALTKDQSGFPATVRFSFEDIGKAWLSARETASNGDVVLNVFQPKFMNEPYPFSIKRFTQQLCDYTYSTDRESENYWMLIPHYTHNSRLPYGRAAYQPWLIRLQSKEKWIL